MKTFQNEIGLATLMWQQEDGDGVITVNNCLESELSSLKTIFSADGERVFKGHTLTKNIEEDDYKAVTLTGSETVTMTSVKTTFENGKYGIIKGPFADDPDKRTALETFILTQTATDYPGINSRPVKVEFKF